MIKTAPRSRKVEFRRGGFDQRFGSQCQGTDDDKAVSVRRRVGRDPGSHGGQPLPAGQGNQKRGKNIVQMVPQSKFVEVILPRVTIKAPAPQTRTEYAGTPFAAILGMFRKNRRNIQTLHVMRNTEPGADGPRPGCVEPRKTGIERDGPQSEPNRRNGPETVQHLQQRQTVQTAGKRDQNPIARRDHAVGGHRLAGHTAEFAEGGAAGRTGTPFSGKSGGCV